MSYIAFARKYRPRIFDEIMGQPHITTTLKNALLKDRVAHAYLFAGPRGVGKTTTARILAKALNCEKPKKPDPCNSCASCNEISQGISMDILEIDGASNRGIDEIRNLRDSIKFAPSKGKFKVYIIDEVHMLTAEAFNALLKILEEPPAHAKFIFATTHPHKVPPTILSRCQRFDFRRILTKDILENLKSITKTEKLKVGDEALALIARSADGSMRDAQVILDQIVSFTEGKADMEDVLNILGLINEEILFALADAIKERNADGALKIIAKVVDEGKDIFQVVLALIEHFRNLLVLKVGKDRDALLDLTNDKIKRFDEQAKKFGSEEILYIIYTLSNTIDFVRKTDMTRIPFETAVIKLANRNPAVSIDDIIKRVERLEAGKTTASPVIARSSPSDLERRSNLKENFQEAEQSKKEIASPLVGLAMTRENSAGDGNNANQVKFFEAWPSIVNFIKAKKISIASYLEEGYPIEISADTVTIGFPKEFRFHKEALESAENKRLIEEAIKEVSKLQMRINLSLIEPNSITDSAAKGYFKETLGSGAGTQGEEVDPIVKEALNIFNGEITGRSNGRKGSK